MPVPIDPKSAINSKQQAITKAADDFAQGIQARESIPLAQPLQDVLKAPDVGAAFKQLISNPEVLTLALSESGITFVKETAAQVGSGFIAGTLTGNPAVGVATASVVGGATVRNDVYNAYFGQQIEKYIAENKLPMTADSVKQFMNNPELVAKAKEDASTTADIVGIGAMAATAVGGGLATGQVMQLAARLGLKPVVQAGEIVFERAVPIKNIAVHGAEAATSTAVMVGSTIGSKIAVGEPVTPGDVVLNTTLAIGAAGADVGTGALFRAGKPVGDPLQIKLGDVMTDTNGKTWAVTGGNGKSVTIQHGEDIKTVDAGTVDQYKVNQSATEQASPPIDNLRPETTQSTALEPLLTKNSFKAELAMPEDKYGKPLLKTDNQQAGFTLLSQLSASLGATNKTKPALPTTSLYTELNRLTGNQLPTILEKVGASITEDRGIVNLDNARQQLIDAFDSTGILVREAGGDYFPVITPFMGQNQVQARHWAAEIANTAQSVNRYSSDTRKINAKIAYDQEQARVATEQAQLVVNQKPPESPPVLDQYLGETVNYGNTQGIIVKENNAFYVADSTGNKTLIESGQSGVGLDQLGISLVNPSKVPRTVILQPDGKTFSVDDKTLTFVKFNTKQTGKTTTILNAIMDDGKGNLLTIRDKGVLAKIDDQLKRYQIADRTNQLNQQLATNSIPPSPTFKGAYLQGSSNSFTYQGKNYTLLRVDRKSPELVATVIATNEKGKRVKLNDNALASALETDLTTRDRFDSSGTIPVKPSPLDTASAPPDATVPGTAPPVSTPPATTAVDTSPIKPTVMETPPVSTFPKQLILPDKSQVPFKLVAIEANNLNPLISQSALQPRDRTRAAYKSQVDDIANNMNYDLISPQYPVMDYGPPVLTKKGEIIAGNGRLLGIKQAYKQGNDSSKTYREHVIEDGIRAGINPDVLNKMKNPILVRQLTTEVNAQQLARQSNLGNGTAMSPMEQAAVDAQLINTLADFTPADNGEITLKNAKSLFKRLTVSMTEGEKNQLITSRGNLSAPGLKRLQNAIMYMAYGEHPVLSRLIEETSSSSKNILHALIGAASHIAESRDSVAQNLVYPIDLAPIISDSLDLYTQIKGMENMTVESYIRQNDAFRTLDPATVTMLTVFDKLKSKPAQLRDVLIEMTNKLSAYGHPNQQKLIDQAPPSALNIISEALATLPKKSMPKDLMADLTDTTKTTIQKKQAAIEKQAAQYSAPTFRAPQREAVTINYGHEPTNYIPENSLSKLSNAGFEVKPFAKQNTGAIHALQVTDPKTQQVFFVTSKGWANPLSIKDRHFSVYEGGTYEGGKIRGGKLLPDYAGNKWFTIPGDVIPIEPGKNFISSLTRSAEHQGLDIELTHGMPPNERVVITKEGKPVAKVSYEGNTVYVDGKPQTGVVGIDRSLLSVAAKATRSMKKDIYRSGLMAEMDKAPPPPLDKIKNDQLDAAIELANTTYQIQPAKRQGWFEMKNNGAVKVEIKVKESPEDVLTMAYIDSFTQPDLVNSGKAQEGTLSFTKGDIDKYVKTLPVYIRNLIKLYSHDNNPAAQLGTWGFFHPNMNNNGPIIAVDIRPIRSLEHIISTLSEEVSHFGFNAWTTGPNQWRMEKFFNKAFDLYKAEIEGSLGNYISLYEVDMANATPHEKYMLVNELFSKQGTAFLDFTDNKAIAPGGLTRDEINQLKTDAREALDGMVIDMIERGKLSIADQEGVKTFAREILRNQAGSVIERPVYFQFKDNGKGQVQTLEIIPTPFGQNRRLIMQNPESQAVANRIRKISSSSDIVGKWRTWLYQSAPWGNMLSTREIERIIGGNTALSHARAQKVLRHHEMISKQAEALLKESGMSDINSLTIANGFVSTFKQRGITRKSALAIAQQADDILATYQHALLSGTDELKIELRRESQLLTDMARSQGIPSNIIAQWTATLRATEKLFKPDWTHTRYRVFEDDAQRPILQEMLNNLNGIYDKKNGSLSKQYDDAQVKIDELFAKVKDKTLSLEDYFKEALPYIQIQQKYTRLEALNKAFHYKAHPSIPYDPSRRYLPEMKAYIAEALKRNEDNGQFLFSTMKQVLKQEVLDKQAGEHTYDFQMREFLDEITNPLEVGIYSVNQQKEVLRTLMANRRLMEALLRLGSDVAWIKGSQDVSQYGSNMLTIGQEGSILNYIELHPAMADNLNTSIRLQSRINNTFLDKIISSAKYNQTVLNFSTSAANYLGIPYLSFFNGHLLYVNKLLEMPAMMKEAWIQQKTERLPNSNETFAQKIVREMNDNQILGSGLQSGSLNIIHNRRIQEATVIKLIDALTSILNTSKATDIKAEYLTRQVFDTINNTYTFSDDIPKVLSYLIDRDISHLEAKATLDPANYKTPELYNQAVDELTQQLAADRTLRQTTDWSISPIWAKRLTHSVARSLIGDYAMFGIQVMKIMSENLRLLKEDMANYVKAGKLGQTEWQSAIGRSIVARGIGNSSMYGSLVFGSLTKYTLLPLTINSVLIMVADIFHLFEDEKKKKLFMNQTQLEAASRLMNNSNYDGAAKYEPFAMKVDKDTLVVANFQRLNPFNVMLAPSDPGDYFDPADQGIRLFRNLIMGGNGNTIYQTMVDAVKGRDRTGKPLDTTVAENIYKVTKDLMTPGFMKSGTEFATGDNWFSNKEKSKVTVALQSLGISTKKVNVPSEISKLGKDIAKKRTARDSITSLLYDISLGSGSISERDIIGRVKADFNATEDIKTRYNYFIQAYRDFGYSTGEIKKYLQSDVSEGGKDTNLADKDAMMMLRGKNLFTEHAIKKLQDKLSEVRQKPISVNFDKDRKNKALSDIKFAIEQYKLLAKSAN